MANKSVILAICAHNDDQIVGSGGTLAKYVAEGKTFYTIIMSFGENSHPHYKPEVIAKIRVEESKVSDKILGGSGVQYFGLREGKFDEDFQSKKIDDKLLRIIDELKPRKIFTHSVNDTHPDHRAVNRLVTRLLEKNPRPLELYSFDVWNIVNFKKRNVPKLVVDVSSTYPKKIEAFQAHTSQKTTYLSLIWKVYARDRFNGWKNGCRYAEVFSRLL